MTFFDTTKAFLTRPLFRSAKAASDRLPLPRGSQRGWGWGGLFGLGFQSVPIDYRADVGDVSQNSAVAACLNWLCTSWPQQVPEIVKKVAGKDEPVDSHPFLDLLHTPNDQYEGVWLHQSLLTDFWTYGRAYCHVVTDDGGQPLELEYMPAACTKAVGDDDGRLDHYEYRPNGKLRKVDPATVLHFRNGIDPDNLLDGKPPLAPAYAEIVADNELSGWSVSLAKNSGVPSGLLSPASSGPDGPYEPITEGDAKAIKALWHNSTTGTNRGKVMIAPGPLKYDRIAFSPKEMSVSDLRKTPEERICALFQIPPGVVGLGAGLDRNTFSNYEEGKKAAWEDNLVPTGDYFASVWTKGLQMYADTAGMRVRYNRSNVRVLHEDETSKHEEAIDQKAAGLITMTEARSLLGYETDQETLDQLASEKPVPPPTPAGDSAFDGKGYAAKSVRSVKKKRPTLPV